MTQAASPVVICLTAGALQTARRVAAALPGATVHGLAGRVTGADLAFEDAMAHLGALFGAGTPLVGICAAGILVRAVAPRLADKTAEPPVIAVAEDGSAVVPLLGGHRGANRLARRIGAALGVAPAITTAGELRLGLALDEPPPGWRVADEAAAKPVAAALLAGVPVGLTVEAGDAGWLQASGARFVADAQPNIVVTHRIGAERDALVLHPPVLALGVGCERDTPPEALIAHVESALARQELSPRSVACVVSIDLKADEPAVHALAASLGVPARFFPAARLAEEAPRLLNPSDTVLRETGCPGVAEGAALAAAGAGSTLILPKTVGPRVTCAVALAPGDIDPARVGRAQGRLAIVGIGPGDRATRTADAVAALTDADDIVGYGLYLELIDDLIAGKPRHATDLGAETERARAALALAAEGRRVALVSSGDAGIYGLATLAWELLEREPDPAWRRVDVRVVPGVSALQVAAARLGAPLGHDFCAISLSDLLTPWAAIERRLQAAAAGDFVVALYNPRSGRRDWQLAKAREILLAQRGPDAPVGIARNLGRPGERVTATTLGALDPAAIDMLTILLIGSSATRRLDRADGAHLYTPRGYAAKADAS